MTTVTFLLEYSKYGISVTDKNFCTRYGGCWDDTFKCYHGRDYVPGYKVIKRESNIGNAVNHPNVPLKECAKICTKDTNRKTFVYNFDTKSCDT